MNRVDRTVALPNLIIYSDNQVSSWHLTHACPHFFVYYDKCVWDSGVYSDLKFYSQSEVVFGQVYSVAIDWTHLWVMLLHLLIPCGITTVNLFITFINSLCADAFCGCMHDTELTLFQALHCSSLAGVTACRCQLECSTIGFIMHSLGVCLAMVHCTSTPCICIYILYLFCSHNIITCSQYSQECPPFQGAPFLTIPEGLQSVCKLSLHVFNRWTTNCLIIMT